MSRDLLVVAVLGLLGACVVYGGDPDPDAEIVGFVYVCASENGELTEWCWNGSATSLANEIGGKWDWQCRPTPRYAGPCIYHCPGGDGCNAYNGCFCLD